MKSFNLILLQIAERVSVRERNSFGCKSDSARHTLTVYEVPGYIAKSGDKGICMHLVQEFEVPENDEVTNHLLRKKVVLT